MTYCLFKLHFIFHSISFDSLCNGTQDCKKESRFCHCSVVTTSDCRNSLGNILNNRALFSCVASEKMYDITQKKAIMSICSSL